jgi:hypothetical protein
MRYSLKLEWPTRGPIYDGAIPKIPRPSFLVYVKKASTNLIIIL